MTLDSPVDASTGLSEERLADWYRSAYYIAHKRFIPSQDLDDVAQAIVEQIWIWARDHDEDPGGLVWSIANQTVGHYVREWYGAWDNAAGQARRKYKEPLTFTTSDGEELERKELGIYDISLIELEGELFVADVIEYVGNHHGRRAAIMLEARLVNQHTFERIGDAHGVTKNRAKQIIDNALHFLREGYARDQHWG